MNQESGQLPKELSEPLNRVLFEALDEDLQGMCAGRRWEDISLRDLLLVQQIRLCRRLAKSD